MPAVRGQDIRPAYENLGYTRRQFAERIAIPPRTLTNIINGNPCSRGVAARIARELGWPIEQVLDEGPTPTGPGRPKDGNPPPNPARPHKKPRRVAA